jgi:prepilin-type N-terminal cleavage/methylation domain-containing protein
MTRHPYHRRAEAKPRGFTLLEVILALVILGAALAMLSNIIQLAGRHAVDSRTETLAQSLAESVMDQVIAGAVEMTSVSRQQLEVDDATPWVYSINVGTSALTTIAPVEVVVEQDIDANQDPVKYHLVRWLPSTLELPEGAAPAGGGGPGAGGGAGGAAGAGSSSVGAGGSMGGTGS